MTPKAKPEHLIVHVLKLKNVIKLKENEVMCEKDIETCSHSESDEANNVCWENSIIQMFLMLYIHYTKCYKIHFSIRFNMKLLI